MKKALSLLLALALTLGIFFIPASAAPKIGDPLGDIVYSDIIAYINGKAIPTSIKNGMTMVVVEDLNNYGFDVTWNGKARTLSVELNAAKKITPLKVEQSAKPVGTFKCKYVYTDIKTYLSGKLVESFAISGVTLIDFELLAEYGSLKWDGKARTISLTTTGTTQKPTDPKGAAISLANTEFSPNENITVSYSGVTADLVTARAWVGIAKQGAKANDYLSGKWEYVKQGSGTVTIKAPAEPGAYEMRFYQGSTANDANLVKSATVAFTLAWPDVITVSVNKTQYNAGDSITVTVSGVTAELVENKCWVAVYKAGGGAKDYSDWKYVEKTGSVTLTLKAPSSSGTYEIRFVPQYSAALGHLAKSQTFTVGSGGGS